MLKEMVKQAIAAVAPDGAVLKHLKLDNHILHVDDKIYSLNAFKRIFVLGAGKGAAPMALALENLLGDRITDGLVIVKYEHGLELKKIRLAFAAHPVPDQEGMDKAWEIIKIAQDATKDDLVICVFTGGASALTPALEDNISLNDLRKLTTSLLECGATIHEINTIRKHLSAFSGGKLAQAAYPAKVISLIVSDVVGDNLDIIASGPTVPDPSTYADCAKLIDKFNLWAELPQDIKIRLEKGLNKQILETPKAYDLIFNNVQTLLIATLSQALQTAKRVAVEHGYSTTILCDNLTGEARIRIAELIEKAKQAKLPNKKICLLAGGETTVTIKGTGLGGRNQEMALQAGILLEHEPQIKLVCVGTDGTDGPTDAAGGFADNQMMPKAKDLGLDLQAYLDNNDSYHALEKTGYLLKTGPTRTNVMDMVAIVIN